MKLNKLLFFILISLLVISCSGGGGGGTGTTSTFVTLASIAVTPANPGIAWGGTQQFTATGTYSDSTTQDITTSVTWSSSNTDVATISNTSGSNGLAASLASGASNITANLNGITSNTAQLTVSTIAMDNVVAVSVNGSLCTNAYPNKPCVSVTICTPGSNTDCQTIDDILLDTGASGLRIFKSVITVSPTQVTSGSGLLADCIQYADNSADWGPVQTVDVILGNETAANVPIHVIDSAFGQPTLCSQSNQYTLDSSPSTAGFNGLLGVGLFAQDCGSTCASVANNGWYYSCSGSTCSETTTTLSDQVQNPVALLPLDNNGVIVRLPVVSLGGAISADGVLILGIDTRSNNSSSGVIMYPADPTYGDLTYGEFITVFPATGGHTYSSSFLDTGSNGLFFDAGSVSALTTCTSGIATGWYCPSSTQSLSATTKGYSGTPSGGVSFKIGDASTLFSSSNWVFSELGAPVSGYFDWGLPFFMGRNVYVGIEQKTSSLGTGPYWAY